MSDNISSIVEKEYILNYLKDQNIPLTIELKENVKFDSYLTHFDRFTLTLKHKSNLPIAPYQKINIHFYFRDNRHFFSTVVKSLIDSHTMIVKLPKEIVRNAKRRFKRVKLDDLKNIQIIFQDKITTLNFPETENFKTFPSKKFENKKLDSIANLIQAFRNRMKVFSNNKIIMLRDKQPKLLEEFLIIKTGKCFFLPNTNKYFPDKDTYDPEKVITKEDLYEYWKLMGVEGNLINKKIDNLLERKKNNSVFSELYYPIIYKKYVVAYIWLSNSYEKNSQISYNTVLKLNDFGNVLIATLLYNNYFETLSKKTKMTQLIDISAGGLQFSTTDKEIIKKIDVDSNLKISFSVKSHYFEFECSVRRKYSKDGKYFLGIQFIKYPIEERQSLEKLLYSS